MIGLIDIATCEVKRRFLPTIGLQNITVFQIDEAPDRTLLAPVIGYENASVLGAIRDIIESQRRRHVQPFRHELGIINIDYMLGLFQPIGQVCVRNHASHLIALSLMVRLVYH